MSKQYETKDSGSRKEFVTGARRDCSVGKGRFDLLPGRGLARVAKLMGRGAVKYGAHNWKKGIPLSSFLDSCARHLFQLIEGQDDEDHAAAVGFNILCFIQTLEWIEEGRLPKELDDRFVVPSPMYPDDKDKDSNKRKKVDLFSSKSLKEMLEEAAYRDNEQGIPQDTYRSDSKEESLDAYEKMYIDEHNQPVTFSPPGGDY